MDAFLQRNDKLFRDIQDGIRQLKGQLSQLNESSPPSLAPIARNPSVNYYLDQLREYEERLLGIEEEAGAARNAVSRYRKLTHNSISPIHALPTEILRDIFSHLIPENPFDSSPQITTVTHVCSLWRSIGLDYSALWSRLDVMWPLEKFETWAERSRNQSLRIRFHVGGSEDEFYSAIENIHRNLSQHQTYWSRTESIDLNINYAGTNLTFYVQELLAPFQKISLPLLKGLTASSDGDDIWDSLDPPLSNALMPSNLQSLDIRSFRISDPSFESLERLTLKYTSFPETWPSLFRSCAALQYLHLEDVATDVALWDDNWRPNPDPPSSVVLPRLQTLVLDSVDLTFYTFITNQCEAPILRSLSFTEYWLLSDAIEMVRTFDTIEYLKCNVAPQDLGKVLEALSKHRHLQDLDVSCGEKQSAVIEAYVQRYILGRMADDEGFAPGRKALRTLFLESCASVEGELWLRERVDCLQIGSA